MNQALVEMLRQTGELDRILDGRGLAFDSAPAPPAPPPPPARRPDPPPWSEFYVEPGPEPEERRRKEGEQ